MKIIPDFGFFSRKGNSWFITILFLLNLLFQTTSLKYIWSIEFVSRLINMLLLFGLYVYLIMALRQNYSRKVWYSYLIPGLMILFGISLNIGLSSISNLSNVSLFGVTVPWALYLLMPYFMKIRYLNSEVIWRWYYFFMMITTGLGMLEYYFFGTYPFNVLDTPYGTFLGGKISMLYMGWDATPHYRFYGCFYEPGTLAMFLLPAIAYAVFKRRIVGLLIMLGAFYMTFSLGGNVSLILLALTIIFLKTNKNRNYMIVAVLVLAVISKFAYDLGVDSFKEEYEKKARSAAQREEGFSKTISNIPVMFFNYPLGIPYSQNTDELEKQKVFSGTNFILGNYISIGGIMAFIGIIIILITSFRIMIRKLLDHKSTLMEKIVFASLFSLFPFIYQRGTIWDSALFSLMFAPYILEALSEGKLKADPLQQTSIHPV